MRNTIAKEFAKQYGIDFSVLDRQQQKSWRRGIYDVRTFGHTLRMPDPPFSLDEIHEAEAIIAATR